MPGAKKPKGEKEGTKKTLTKREQAKAKVADVFKHFSKNPKEAEVRQFPHPPPHTERIWAPNHANCPAVSRAADSDGRAHR